MYMGGSDNGLDGVLGMTGTDLEAKLTLGLGLLA
jgi:hypothetical protein